MIPSNQPPLNISFGFESAFEDDFDFAAPKASPAPASNGSIHSHNEQSLSRLTPPKLRPTSADKLKEKEQPTRSLRLRVSSRPFALTIVFIILVFLNS